jgi:hypothetical protein
MSDHHPTAHQSPHGPGTTCSGEPCADHHISEYVQWLEARGYLLLPYTFRMRAGREPRTTIGGVRSPAVEGNGGSKEDQEGLPS